MKKTLTLFCFWWLATALHAQTPASYTTKQYGWRVEKDLEYGTATNYAGIPTLLTLDLYKPLGDDNPQRPLLVLVHGGAWLTGCKEHEAALAVEFAQRGYTVASVNYRKGWHKAASVNNPPPDHTGYPSNCLYAADSMELIRAIYRGQQDVKGAIRWLKARSAQDSTCNQKVMVGGSSAGAFLSLAVGLIDRPEEKSSACFALPDAPVPSPNVTNCFEENCIMTIINPTPDGLKRPDLGPIDGELNLNGYDCNVLGISSFFGGVPYEALSYNWLQGPDTPAMYLYHQTCDGVVPFGYGSPFEPLSAHCNLGYSTWHTTYMHVFGNGAIASALESIPNPPNFTTEFVPCDPFVPALALFECIRYANNGSYHYPHNLLGSAQLIANFFSPVIQQGNCFSLGASEPGGVLQAQVSPNPFGQRLSVFMEENIGEAVVSLTDISGKTIWARTQTLVDGENVLLAQNQFPAGFYALHIRSKNGAGVWKIVRE